MMGEEAVLSKSTSVQNAASTVQPLLCHGKGSTKQNNEHTGCLNLLAGSFSPCAQTESFGQWEGRGMVAPVQELAKLLHTLSQFSAHLTGNRWWPGSEKHRKDHVCNTRKWPHATFLLEITSDILFVNSAQWIPAGQNGRCCSSNPDHRLGYPCHLHWHSSVTESKPFMPGTGKHHPGCWWHLRWLKALWSVLTVKKCVPPPEDSTCSALGNSKATIPSCLRLPRGIQGN